jgi:hypothetical protein
MTEANSLGIIQGTVRLLKNAYVSSRGSQFKQKHFFLLCTFLLSIFALIALVENKTFSFIITTLISTVGHPVCRLPCRQAGTGGFVISSLCWSDKQAVLRRNYFIVRKDSFGENPDVYTTGFT